MCACPPGFFKCSTHKITRGGANLPRPTTDTQTPNAAWSLSTARNATRPYLATRSYLATRKPSMATSASREPMNTARRKSTSPDLICFTNCQGGRWGQSVGWEWG